MKEFKGLPRGVRVPDRVAMLPEDPVRHVPVPWFVPWVDGKPEFRAADPEKLRDAILGNRCWVCGDVLGVHKAAVLGPMCIVNRNTAEPPCHRECAVFSCQACPFLTKPHMDRRDHSDITTVEPGGMYIARNPGVVAVWVTRSVVPYNAGNGVNFMVGEPSEVLWFREGRTATAEEVRESVESGLPLLREAAEKGGPEDVAELERLIARAQPYLYGRNHALPK